MSGAISKELSAVCAVGPPGDHTANVPGTGRLDRTGQCMSLFYSCRCIFTHAFLEDFFFEDFIYLFMRDIQREAETQAEREADSLWGARCGT